MKSIAIGFFLMTAVLLTSFAQATKWTDVTGDEVEQVQLGKADGTTAVAPPEKLTPADREHTKRQAEATKTLQGNDKATTGRDAARTYPSFPDAVTELPAWNDAKPPFDVVEFLKNVPREEENAAPLYLDAFFEFNPEMSICYGPPSEPPQGEAKRREEAARKRCQEQRRFDKAWEKDPLSVDGAAVDAWLKQYDVGFKKLAAAQQRPRCVFQTGLSCVLLTPHVPAARDVARVVEWRIRRDLQRREFERPLDDVETVLRMSRDFRPRGVVISQWISMIVERMCCRQMAPAILTTPGIKKRHCDRLLALLTEHEAKAIDPFLEENRVGYVVDRLTLHDLQHRTGTFDPRFMKEGLDLRGNVMSWWTCIRLLNTFDEISPFAEERMRAIIDSKGKLEHPVLPKALIGGKVLSDADYIDEVNALNRVYASILCLAERPDRPLPDEFKKALAHLREPLRKTTLAMLLTSAADETELNATLRGQATVRGTQCLVAVRRWQLEHEELAKNLDTIIKAAGLRSVPIDPYSGRPLQMTVIEGKPVIYSVGPDGKDDKALVESKGGSQPGDILFRFESSSD